MRRIYSPPQTSHIGSICIPSTRGAGSPSGARTAAVPTFSVWEDKHVLSFTSHPRGAQFYIGTYANHRFTPERHKRLALGETGRPGVYNEGLTLLDDQGRRILFGRLHEGRYSYVQRASGWAGMFALPMVLSLSADGDLLVEPVPELGALRGEHAHFSAIQLAADDDLQLDAIKGKPTGNSRGV